jgi:hypothetical protein
VAERVAADPVVNPAVSFPFLSLSCDEILQHP